jgi:predicted nucleotide-binding protein (sugar kinase/HSP70/actin superfamily)
VTARRGRTTIFIPYMSDASLVVAAAFEAAGFPAQVFPRSNEETLVWGKKFTSGKECYPCVVTTGDMVRITRDPSFRPESSAFFMPSTSGPCRFGQYCQLQRMVLDSLGHTQVPILAPMQDTDFYGDMAQLGPGFFRRAWRGLVAVDLLDRIRRENRP